MKKFLLTIILSIVSFNMIHADVTWKLSDDGTLTISGTDMPDYYYSYKSKAPWLPQKDKIKKVVINNGVTNIGSAAFFGCSNLTSISIPNSVKSIGNHAFYNCGLTSVTIPNSVKSIEEATFCDCTKLTSVTIPNSVTSIGNHAFYGCSSLTSVAIPNSVTTIGMSAFMGCEKLTSVTIPNSVTTIKASTFSDTSLTSVTIPNSVTTIEKFAFYNCRKLTSVTIPNSVTSIGNSVFEECDALTSVTNLAKTPQKIGDKTFTKYGTLHVVSGCKAKYEDADYWNNFTIVEDANGSGTTEVADVETGNGMKDGKYLIDGKVVIVRNGKKYNLNGIAE